MSNPFATFNFSFTKVNFLIEIKALFLKVQLVIKKVENTTFLFVDKKRFFSIKNITIKDCSGVIIQVVNKICF